jgi:hypothetical protein
MASGSESYSPDVEKQRAVSLNLNSNAEARIQNPLAGIPRAQLLREVEEFAKEKDLTDILPILTKGALCKQLASASTIISSQFALSLQSGTKPPGFREA